MAPVSAQPQSSGSIFTISKDDLKNIVANVIRMVGASYSSSLLTLSSMSPISWLMDSTCFNYMIPYSFYFLNLNLHHTLLIFAQQMVPQCLIIIQIPFLPPTSRFLGSLMFLTFLTIYSIWNNQLSWVIALSLIILGVLCRFQGQDRSLGPVQELGICFPWTTFVFHLLLLFLLLQLLQFLLFIPLHFGMLDLVTHLPLSSQVQQLASRGLLGLVSTKNLIVFHVSQENNQLFLSILVNQYPLISLILFILMFWSLPFSLVLVGLNILLSLLMITVAIA